MLRSSPQGGPGSELRGFELLQPGWFMWEETLRGALDARLLRDRVRGDRSLRPTASAGLVFGDRSAGDDAPRPRFSNPQRMRRVLGHIYPDMLLVDEKSFSENGGKVAGAAVLCGDFKYYDACALRPAKLASRASASP